MTRSLGLALMAGGIAVTAALAGCESPTDPPAGAGVETSTAATSRPSASPAGSGSGEPTGAATVVLTRLLSFEPGQLTVRVGETVTWRVSDTIDHTVTTGSFTVGGDGLRTAEQPDGVISLPLTSISPASYAFTKPGTYRYYCSIHKGMTGEIHVVP